MIKSKNQTVNYELYEKGEIDQRVEAIVNHVDALESDHDLILTNLDTEIKANTDAINIVAGRATDLEGRVDVLEDINADERLSSLEERSDSLEERADSLEERSDALEQTADDLEGAVVFASDCDGKYEIDQEVDGEKTFLVEPKLPSKTTDVFEGSKNESDMLAGGKDTAPATEAQIWRVIYNSFPPSTQNKTEYVVNSIVPTAKLPWTNAVTGREYGKGVHFDVKNRDIINRDRYILDFAITSKTIDIEFFDELTQSDNPNPNQITFEIPRLSSEDGWNDPPSDYLFVTEKLIKECLDAIEGRLGHIEEDLISSVLYAAGGNYREDMTQQISGVKQFMSHPVVPNKSYETHPIAGVNHTDQLVNTRENEYATESQLYGINIGTVHTTGDERIGGYKTFTGTISSDQLDTTKTGRVVYKLFVLPNERDAIQIGNSSDLLELHSYVDANDPWNVPPREVRAHIRARINTGSGEEVHYLANMADVNDAEVRLNERIDTEVEDLNTKIEEIVEGYDADIEGIRTDIASIEENLEQAVADSVARDEAIQQQAHDDLIEVQTALDGRLVKVEAASLYPVGDGTHRPYAEVLYERVTDETQNKLNVLNQNMIDVDATKLNKAVFAAGGKYSHRVMNDLDIVQGGDINKVTINAEVLDINVAANTAESKNFPVNLKSSDETLTMTVTPRTNTTPPVIDLEVDQDKLDNVMHLDWPEVETISGDKSFTGNVVLKDVEFEVEPTILSNKRTVYTWKTPDEVADSDTRIATEWQLAEVSLSRAAKDWDETITGDWFFDGEIRIKENKNEVWNWGDRLTDERHIGSERRVVSEYQLYELFNMTPLRTRDHDISGYWSFLKGFETDLINTTMTKRPVFRYSGVEADSNTIRLGNIDDRMRLVSRALGDFEANYPNALDPAVGPDRIIHYDAIVQHERHIAVEYPIGDPRWLAHLDEVELWRNKRTQLNQTVVDQDVNGVRYPTVKAVWDALMKVRTESMQYQYEVEYYGTEAEVNSVTPNDGDKAIVKVGDAYQLWTREDGIWNKESLDQENGFKYAVRNLLSFVTTSSAKPSGSIIWSAVEEAFAVIEDEYNEPDNEYLERDGNGSLTIIDNAIDKGKLDDEINHDLGRVHNDTFIEKLNIPVNGMGDRQLLYTIDPQFRDGKLRINTHAVQFNDPVLEGQTAKTFHDWINVAVDEGLRITAGMGDDNKGEFKIDADAILTEIRGNRSDFDTYVTDNDARVLALEEHVDQIEEEIYDQIDLDRAESEDRDTALGTRIDGVLTLIGTPPAIEDITVFDWINAKDSESVSRDQTITEALGLLGARVLDLNNSAHIAFFNVPGTSVVGTLIRFEQSIQQLEGKMLLAEQRIEAIYNDVETYKTRFEELETSVEENYDEFTGYIETNDAKVEEIEGSIEENYGEFTEYKETTDERLEEIETMNDELNTKLEEVEEAVEDKIEATNITVGAGLNVTRNGNNVEISIDQAWLNGLITSAVNAAING